MTSHGCRLISFGFFCVQRERYLCCFLWIEIAGKKKKKLEDVIRVATAFEVSYLTTDVLQGAQRIEFRVAVVSARTVPAEGVRKQVKGGD